MSEDDEEAFAEKMSRLTNELAAQFEESSKLETEIKKNLINIGFELPEVSRVHKL